MGKEIASAAMDFRKILSDELHRRAEVDPTYSLRRFARDLELSPSSLSDVLNKKHGLSAAKARSVAKHLGYDKDAAERFCALVVYQCSRSKDRRVAAFAKILGTEASPPELIRDSLFETVASWVHYAILALIDTPDFRDDPAWIADRLGVDTATAVDCLERLERVHLLERGPHGQLRVRASRTHTETEMPSEARRRFHAGLLEKATETLAKRPPTERMNASVLLTFDPGRLTEAKEALQTFYSDFMTRFGTSPESTEVFALNLNLFPVTQ